MFNNSEPLALIINQIDTVVNCGGVALSHLLNFQKTND